MPTLRDLLDPIITEAVNNAVDAYRKMLLAEGVVAAAPVKKKLGRPPGAKNKVHVAAPNPSAKMDPRQVANDQAAAAVLAFITMSPGLRGDQIAQGMGGTSTTVNKALAKLRTTKQVKTKGKGRGMTYYPAGGSAGTPKPHAEESHAAAPPAKTKKRKKGAHRTKAEIAANDARVLAFIKASPGLRTEQIVKGLGGDAGDVAFALAHLRGKKKVKAKGYGRWTVYSA